MVIVHCTMRKRLFVLLTYGAIYEKDNFAIIVCNINEDIYGENIMKLNCLSMCKNVWRKTKIMVVH